MSENYIDESSKNHFLILGKAVHGWADVEHSIYKYLDSSCRTEYARKVLMDRELHKRKGFEYMSFNVRIQILYVLVDARLNSSDRDEQLDNLKIIFKKLIRLNSRRNQFAHNPIGYWLSEDDKDIVNGLMIGSKVGRPEEFSDFSLDEIELFSSEVAEAHNELKTLMTSIQFWK